MFHFRIGIEFLNNDFFCQSAFRFYVYTFESEFVHCTIHAWCDICIRFALRTRFQCQQQNRATQRERESAFVKISCVFSEHNKISYPTSSSNNRKLLCNVDSCSQLKMFAHLICYLQKACMMRAFKMHVILRCKLPNSPYIIHVSGEHLLTARISVSIWYWCMQCNLCVCVCI